MFKSKSYEIPSTDDVELGIKRDSLLEFKLSFDDEKEMKALFFFINGIRSGDYEGYEEHLAEFVVKEFDVAVVRVDYHCIGFRPQLGAKFYMDKKDKELFAHFCGDTIALPEEFFTNENLSEPQILSLCASLSELIERFKSQGKVAPDFCAPISLTLQPTKNEYQNFGIMQALDILNALCFVKKNAPFKLKKDYKTLLFGTSHGGYVALLAAKFAPWLIDAVVENSAYVSVPFRMLGFGKEIDYLNIAETSFYYSPNVFCLASTKTHFSSDENSPNFFSKAHLRIRNPLDEKQLQIQAKHRKVVFISYHGINDTLALPQEKQSFYDALQTLNFEARLNLIKDKSEVDGKFIKNLEHGMDLSLKMLIKKELPPLLARKFTRTKNEKKEITYQSENLEYHFKESTRGGGGIDLIINKSF